MTSSTTRRGYLDLPWGQVHYRTAAADPALPVMIMLHQSPLSARNYERVLPLLARFCRPVAIDTPGHGASDPAPGPWEVADYAQLVWTVADALGAGLIHLFGRATGSVFAFAAAQAAPLRVRTLLLHGVPIYTDAERADRLANFAPPYPLSAEGDHLGWIWRRIRGEYPWIGPELATQFVRDYLAAGPDFAAAYRAIWRYDLRAAAARRAKLPTLLLGGSADRIAFMQARAEALMPDAEPVVLDGATDFVAEQDPARFAGCIADFLARHAG